MRYPNFITAYYKSLTNCSIKTNQIMNSNTAANSKQQYKKLLAQRTRSPSALLGSKPKWGHTSFRGSLFSRPDHHSEIQLHEQAYVVPSQGQSRVSQRANSINIQRSQPRYVSQRVAGASKEHRKSHSLHSMDHPEVAVPKYGVDRNGANAQFHFENYLAHRNSPEAKQKKKYPSRKRWGHKTSASRGTLFSRPDNNSEIRRERQKNLAQQTNALAYSKASTEMYAKKGRSRYMSQPTPMLVPGMKTATNHRRELDQKLTDWEAQQAVAATKSSTKSSEVEDDDDYDEYEQLATSGKAPTPSEVNKLLLREQRRTRDLSMWARDANVFQANAVVIAYEEVKKNLRFCQILLGAKDPYALKLLEAVATCNNALSDTIVVTKQKLPVTNTLERSLPAERLNSRNKTRTLTTPLSKNEDTAAAAAAAAKQAKFAFGKKVSNLGAGYGRTGWAYAHQNNQIKDGIVFVGDTAVSIKKNRPDTRLEHSHAKEMGNISIKRSVLAIDTNNSNNDPNQNQNQNQNVEQRQTPSPRRPDDKVPRTERRKHAWGDKQAHDLEENEDEDVDINNIIEDAMLGVTFDEDDEATRQNALQHRESDLTVEIVRDIMGHPESRSSSVAGTVGTQPDASLRTSFDTSPELDNSDRRETELEEPEDTETRYTDEWEVDSQNEEDPHMMYAHEMQSGELQVTADAASDHTQWLNGKPGFNNVLYHGNTEKMETFTSPSKESLRRHPFDQKVSDKLTGQQMRRNLEEGGRSATWLTRCVQVADDGAIWVSDNIRNPEKIKISKRAKWPTSSPGTSSQHSLQSTKRQQTSTHTDSGRPAFKKKYGRAVSSGNAEFHYVNWLASRTHGSKYNFKHSTHTISPRRGGTQQKWQ